MLDSTSSWDSIFRACLGGYVVFSALFFLALLLKSGRGRKRDADLDAQLPPHDALAPDALAPDART
jgi:hypothetical protein